MNEGPTDQQTERPGHREDILHIRKKIKKTVAGNVPKVARNRDSGISLKATHIPGRWTSGRLLLTFFLLLTIINFMQVNPFEYDIVLSY